MKRSKTKDLKIESPHFHYTNANDEELLLELLTTQNGIKRR